MLQQSQNETDDYQIYTVGNKKRASLFLIITPAFPGQFLYFLYQWKQE